ncbi:hypothetical protein NQ317_013777 [Molorchus minor]|uniref:Uncharacterized protein n=1 Tax=Molorchus minor TaxID=1323400 RepID=A0ABQ9IVV0_9CUCU|nr:hypothetical protein NQ317_013777 [Molorchus minor]
MPVNLQDNFLKERYEQDEKYIYVYDIYTPNYNRPVLTSKFYSKYEGDVAEVDPIKLETLRAAKDRGPKDKREWPETTSHYGWFLTPLVDYDRDDSRLYFPRRSSEMTRHAVRVLLSKVGGKEMN